MDNNYVPGLSASEEIGSATGARVYPNDRFADMFNRLLRRVEAIEQRIKNLEESDPQSD